MKIQTPVTLGELQLRNRIVMPPMVMFIAGEEGHVTPRHLHHYRARAAAGTPIAKGTLVKVDRIEGVKAFVIPVEVEATVS